MDATDSDVAAQSAQDGGALRDHLALIAEMSRAFSQSLNIDETLKVGLDMLGGLMRAEAVSVFLVDPSAREIVCRACIGASDITGLRLPVDTGIIGRAILSRSTQLVRDVTKDPDFGAMVDEMTGFTTRSILCAPLLEGRECLGAVEVMNKRGGDGLFDQADRLLLDAMAASAALAIQNARRASRLMEQQRLQRELELAFEIQRSLLPGARPPAFPVHGVAVPARTVSGDFFDILELDETTIWFAVGDVAGKGVNAALLMAKTASLFRVLGKTMRSPGRMLDAINTELCETAINGMFVTMACGTYDRRDGRVRLANAGHEPPLMWDPAEARFTELPAEAPPLGIDLRVAGPAGYPEQVVQLRGRRLYVFSDGLTEAETGSGHLGPAAVRDLILQVSTLPPSVQPQALVDAVRRMGRGVRDDVTVLLVNGDAPAGADG